MMTSQEYIESLRKLKTRVYMFGEKIENWVDHPMIRPSINCVAMTYALAQDPQYADLMTVKSSLTGHTINRFTHLHQSTEDLVNKVKMQRLLGQKTASCFQRCVGMDSFNAVFSTTWTYMSGSAWSWGALERSPLGSVMAPSTVRSLSWTMVRNFLKFSW